MDLKYFCRRNTFWSLLFETQKYNEFLCGKEMWLSLILSALTTTMICLLYNDVAADIFTDFLKGLLGLLIPGMIGLLGFLVTGLAMLASIMTGKAVQKINQHGKARSLIGILFSFYFEGFCVGANIVFMVFTYFLISFSAPFHYIGLRLMSLLESYLFWFTVIYAITLLGSCINFYMVNIYYTEYIKDN